MESCPPPPVDAAGAKDAAEDVAPSQLHPAVLEVVLAAREGLEAAAPRTTLARTTIILLQHCHNLAAALPQL